MLGKNIFLVLFFCSIFNSNLFCSQSNIAQKYVTFLISGRFEQNLNNDIQFEAERLMKLLGNFGEEEKKAAMDALISEENDQSPSQELEGFMGGKDLCDLVDCKSMRSPQNLLTKRRLPIRGVIIGGAKRVDPMSLDMNADELVPFNVTGSFGK